MFYFKENNFLIKKIKKPSTPYRNRDKNIEKNDTIIVVICKFPHLGQVMQ